MSYKYGDRSTRRMQGVNNDLVDCAVKALAECPYDMTIPWMGGVRTAKEQNDIYKTGASTKDGYDKKSYHQSGNALDIIPVMKDCEKSYRKFAGLMFTIWQREGYKGILQWGGHWANFIDKPHWQVKF